MKIASLQIENVKRVRAVSLSPKSGGLTVIGGNNGEGKTSVLDAITFALGGKRHAPTKVRRDGSAGDPYIKIVMDNGLVVERKGPNSSLSVTDPDGAKSGQALLDSFVSELAIDLPSFIRASDREKAKSLLGVLGIGDKLFELEQREKTLYDQRRDIGVVADQKKKHFRAMPVFDGVPEEPVSVSELIRLQQAMMQRNARNQALRDAAVRLKGRLEDARARLERIHDEVTSLEADAHRAETAAANAVDESPAEIEKAIASAEEVNAKVRANLDKEKAGQEYEAAQAEYDELTTEIEKVRGSRTRLLDGANLPLEGLSISDGCLIYKNQRWDCMSGAEQLMVAVAVASAINPNCRFVLLDELEKFDTDTLEQFGKWLEEHDLQAICTRVSTGDECTVVIEDGLAKDTPGAEEEPKPAKKKFTPGQF